MNPTHYQSKDGGPWYKWTNGKVSPSDLESPRKEFLGSGFYVNGCLVVALKNESTKEVWYAKTLTTTKEKS